VRSRIHRGRAQLRAALAHRDRQAGRRTRQPVKQQNTAGEP
jgi:DNA-directed RNA polymerase specialized sigma24 family protein